MIAAHCGQAAVVNGVLPILKLALILRIRVAKSADSSYAHPIKICPGFSGVALKVAMKRAIFLRDGEFVARFSEVVHTDVAVTGFDKLEKTGAKDFKLLHAFR